MVLNDHAYMQLWNSSAGDLQHTVDVARVLRQLSSKHKATIERAPARGFCTHTHLPLLCVCIELVQVVPVSKMGILPVFVQRNGLLELVTLQHTLGAGAQRKPAHT